MNESEIFNFMCCLVGKTLKDFWGYVSCEVLPDKNTDLELFKPIFRIR